MEEQKICKRCDDALYEPYINPTLCDMCLLQHSIRKCKIRLYEDEIDELDDIIDEIQHRKPWFKADILFDFRTQLCRNRRLSTKQKEVIKKMVINHLGREYLEDYNIIA